MRLKYHNKEAFALHGSSCLTLCEEEIKKDTELRKQWDKIFQNFKLTAVTEEDSIKISKVELYENIVSRFLNISNNEFRKDILQKFGKEKSERLRKKWSQRKLIINALERRKQQPQDSEKQARMRSRSYQAPVRN